MISDDVSVAITYDTIADYFDITRRKVWDDIAHAIKNVAQGNIALDIGCGNGRHIDHLLAMGFKSVIGIDISKRMIEIACNKYGNRCNLMLGHASSIPLKSGICDFVLNIATLHHISTRDGRIKAIAECKRVLKDGGTGIITVWYHPKLHGKGDTYVPWKSSSGNVIAQRYYYMYDMGEFESDIIAGGLCDYICDLKGQNIICIFKV